LFKILTLRTEGNICVRGRPCFPGYAGESHTGKDFGSKKGINHGGEIIGPMKVEAPSLRHRLPGIFGLL
jgi:hypothetical protein